MGDTDFLKGFELDDYDMDLGLSFVDSKPDAEESTATAQVVETISTKVEGIGNLEEKVDDIQSTLSGIKALLDFDELNIEGKLDTLLERVGDTEATDEEIARKVKEETTDKMKDLEKLVLPLLVNFIKPESLEQEYIYWPNRKEIIERQIQRILSITRG
jgi:predicted lipoprotein